MKSWMPWMLVAALVAGVGFAVFSSTPVPERMTPAPGVPLPLSSAQDDEEPASPGMPSEPPQETLTGVIREHIDVSQYTYLRLATEAGETWAAVYRAPVKDGATVTVEHASALRGFHSTELKRDFREIWFGILPGYEHAPASGAPAASGAPPAASAKGPAGTISIAALAKGAASLEGKQATISGRVVKENDGIMGRNWLHVQDGSGSAADGTNDILITSDGTAKIGDTIVATGTVRTNQDFGSGYAYKFMIEKAAVRPASAP